MKLLNKTSIFYLLFALPVFTICSFVLYNLVSYEIQDNVDESLWKKKVLVEEHLRKGKPFDSLTELSAIIDNPIELKPTDQIQVESNYHFSDTMIYDKIEDEVLPYRVLTAIVSDGKNNFEFIARKSSIESDDLIESIIYPVLVLFSILLIGFFLINWYVSKKLWKPFYSTLEKLKVYRIDDTSVLFEKTSIQEFSELNKTLKLMTEKIHKDFISQKQFIENASHEIQTPLAVIKNKIELLIQSNTLSESDMQIIQSLYNASNKLSSLNKALLLLSKIENNQFKEANEIKFKLLIEKTIEHFQDIISHKNIKVEKSYLADPSFKMNSILADILISNLIQNAIRHNIEGGSITIRLSENSIVFSNASNYMVNNTNELFQRFRKNEASAESIGLGLAIVKEICDKYKIAVNYSCKDLMHTIELKF